MTMTKAKKANSKSNITNITPENISPSVFKKVNNQCYLCTFKYISEILQKVGKQKKSKTKSKNSTMAGGSFNLVYIFTEGLSRLIHNALYPWLLFLGTQDGVNYMEQLSSNKLYRLFAILSIVYSFTVTTPGLASIRNMLIPQLHAITRILAIDWPLVTTMVNNITANQLEPLVPIGISSLGSVITQKFVNLENYIPKYVDTLSECIVVCIQYFQLNMNTDTLVFDVRAVLMGA